MLSKLLKVNGLFISKVADFLNLPTRVICFTYSLYLGISDRPAMFVLASITEKYGFTKNHYLMYKAPYSKELKNRGDVSSFQ